MQDSKCTLAILTLSRDLAIYDMLPNIDDSTDETDLTEYSKGRIEDGYISIHGLCKDHDITASIYEDFTKRYTLVQYRTVQSITVLFLPEECRYFSIVELEQIYSALGVHGIMYSSSCTVYISLFNMSAATLTIMEHLSLEQYQSVGSTDSTELQSIEQSILSDSKVLEIPLFDVTDPVYTLSNMSGLIQYSK